MMILTFILITQNMFDINQLSKAKNKKRQVHLHSTIACTAFECSEMFKFT